MNPPPIGPATLLMDEIWRDPAKLRAFHDAVERCTPGWLRDQAAAAVQQVRGGLDRVAESGLTAAPVPVAPNDTPEWTRLGLLHTFIAWVGGVGATCMHAPRPDRPQPVAAAAWKPDLVVCAACTHLLLLARNSTADRRCDGCGRVTAGTAHDDPIWPALLTYGSLVYQLGTCRACRYWEAPK